MTESAAPIEKIATGIAGLDVATRGGLPRRGVTLVTGDAGAGKTVMSLQTVAHAAARGLGAVVVSFEEEPAALLRNVDGFPWSAPLSDDTRVRIIDARPLTLAQTSGRFDIDGLLVVAGAAAEDVDAAWLVIDGIDHLLDLEGDDRVAVAEIGKLERWSHEHDLAVLLTGKRPAEGSASSYVQSIEFLLATSIALTRRVHEQRMTRQLRVVKYRGSSHVADEVAMIINESGVNVFRALPWIDVGSSTDRVSSGIPALDEILGGGLYRGSTLLLSGAPGTSKTTLAAAFALAAAERGETVLFISFDEPVASLVRNLRSVGIDLQPHIDAGTLVLEMRTGREAATEEHTILIQHELARYRPSMLVVDPVSAMLNQRDGQASGVALEYVLWLTRSSNTTSIMTAMRSGGDGVEATESQISTMADTWISLDYRITDGERNRALSIVKSRGTAHSNVVRELVLSSEGIDLAEVFRHEGKVLFGGARLAAEERAALARSMEVKQRQRVVRDLEAQIAAAKARQLEAEAQVGRLEIELSMERENGMIARERAAAWAQEATEEKP
jgi:circadian clock protein KaiC